MRGARDRDRARIINSNTDKSGDRRGFGEAVSREGETTMVWGEKSTESVPYVCVVVGKCGCMNSCTLCVCALCSRNYCLARIRLAFYLSLTKTADNRHPRKTYVGVLLNHGDP